MSSLKTAADIMTRRIVGVGPKDELVSALKLMTDNGFHHLPVVDPDGVLLGIISDRDIKKFSSPFVGSAVSSVRDRATMHISVDTIMVKQVVKVGRSSTIRSCVEAMLQHQIHALPVTDEGNRIIGMVTVTNLLQSYLSLL